MKLKFYFTHSGDKFIQPVEPEQIDDILVADTTYGNKIYWNYLTEEIERIDWVNPATKNICQINKEKLDTFNSYYLQSYGDNMERIS